MNKWKKSFMWLAGFNALIIVLVIILFIWLAAMPHSTLPSQEQKLTTTEPIFTVSSHKQQLAQMINEEIGKHPTGNLTFHVEMTDTLNLVGNLKILGLEIPFELIFSPHVHNGDILLTEKSAKIGVFSLPESQVLKFIKAGGSLPDWVNIEPSDKQINVQLSQYKIKGSYILKAKKMDLAKDQLSFNLYHVSENAKKQQGAF
ncbi:YpmS family protein [Pullulanibacillus camelliae]|nr:YpmS family protein [Pullulanibacillus camelliae]